MTYECFAVTNIFKSVKNRELREPVNSSHIAHCTRHSKVVTMSQRSVKLTRKFVINQLITSK